MPQTCVMYPSRVISTVVLPLPGHGQQQHWAVYGLHRRPLLRVQRRHMGGCKFGLSMAAPFGK